MIKLAASSPYISHHPFALHAGGSATSRLLIAAIGATAVDARFVPHSRRTIIFSSARNQAEGAGRAAALTRQAIARQSAERGPSRRSGALSSARCPLIIRDVFGCHKVCRSSVAAPNHGQALARLEVGHAHGLSHIACNVLPTSRLKATAGSGARPAWDGGQNAHPTDGCRTCGCRQPPGQGRVRHGFAHVLLGQAMQNALLTG